MKINICASANSKYSKYLHVMLLSVLENNMQDDLCVYIFQRDFTLKDKEHLNALFNKYNQSIFFLDIDEKDYECFPAKNKYSLEAYFRFDIIRKIPQEIKRVLYLDVDLIIRGSLRELYSVDMGNNYFAACPDMIAYELFPDLRKLYKRYYDLRYFNSGVMVWNLDALRKNVQFEDFVQIAENLGYQLNCVDQDILNYKYYDKVLYLDSTKYNYMVTKYLRDGWNENEENNALILHYTYYSPWGGGPKTPIYKVWWEYAKKTEFYVELLEEHLKNIEKYVYENTIEHGILNPQKVLKEDNISKLNLLRGKGKIGQRLKESDNKYCLYGAGLCGRKLFDAIVEDNASEKVVAIMDQNKDVKLGIVPTYQDFSWINDEEIYTIIITPSFEIPQIYNRIINNGKKNINVITLQEFLDSMEYVE